MLRFPLLLLLLFFSFCHSNDDLKNPTLTVEGFRLQNQFPIKEISVKSRVVQNKKGNLNQDYALEFDSKDEELILTYKPSKIQINLPYINASSIFVNLNYDGNIIKSNFKFPSGWIDSAELNGTFYINSTTGWVVPLSAIYSPFGENQYIIKSENGKAVKIPVTVLRLDDDKVIVVGGLKSGDILITSRQGEIIDGLTLKVTL